MTSHSRPAPAARESGSALLSVLVVTTFLAVLGVSLIHSSQADFRVATAQRDMTQARYLAEVGLRDVPIRQNDAALSPRFLYRDATYQAAGVDPLFQDWTLTEPGSGKPLGLIQRRVVGGKDPRVDLPPFRLRSTARVNGAVRSFEADLASASLLEYVLWAEADASIGANSTYSGKVYSSGTITLAGAPVVFEKQVEYVTALVNPGYGSYLSGSVDLAAPHDSLISLVDLQRYEDAAKGAGACGSGVGIYIGADPGQQHELTFQRTAAGGKGKSVTPATSMIDLTLLDLSGPAMSPAQPVRYNGVALSEFGTGAPLVNFNGIIFVEHELHVWGINGGRSVEDQAVRDGATGNPAAKQYPGPNGTGNNWYSNNTLDPGEDGTGGGVADGRLDPRRIGRGLTIVTGAGFDIYVDHNVMMGEDPAGRPVKTALISGAAIHVLPNSPRALVIEASMLALGSTVCPGSAWAARAFIPCGLDGDHADNWWARRPDGSYAYDLDRDGTLEVANGAALAADANENSMLAAWTLLSFGNLIVAGGPSSGQWAAGGHPRLFQYDAELLDHAPPCYPILPTFSLVPGTFAEVR